MKKFKLAGSTIGRLLILAEIKKDPYNYLRCQCSCGKIVETERGSVLARRALSCGCLRSEMVVKRLTKHGDAVPGAVKSEYRIWDGIKQRCTNPASQDFKDYGGRGITICSRWQHSYPTFLADMGRKPGPEYSIDRIDVDGDYEPANCRWATPKQQASNTRWSKSHGKA